MIGRLIQRFYRRPSWFAYLSVAFFFSGPFVVHCEAKGVAPISIHASLGGPSRSGESYDFGYNANLVRGPQWSDPLFQARIDELSMKTVRYPGGTVANYWNWETGWFVDNYPNLPNDYANMPFNPHTLASLAEVVVPRGIRVVFDLNVMTSTLSSQLAMLAEANRLGIAIERIELGNELFFPGAGTDTSGFSQAFPDVESYAAMTIVWMQAIRLQYPLAKIAIIGATAKVGAGTRRATWNARLTAYFTNSAMNPVGVYPDAITLHSYRKISTVEASNLTNWVKTAATLEADTMKLEMDGLVAGFGGAPIKFWFTEYNLDDDFDLIRGTWAHGLYVTTLGLKFLQDARVTQALVHNLVADAIYGVLFQTTSGFGTPGSTNRLDQSALGHQSGLLGEMMARATANHAVFYPLEFPTGSDVAGEYATRRGTKYIFLVNSSGSARTIDLNNLLGASLITRSRSVRAGLSDEIGRQSAGAETKNPPILNDVLQPVGGILTLRPYEVLSIESAGKTSVGRALTDF